MLIQEARSKRRRSAYTNLQNEEGAWAVSHRLPDGSINYALFKTRARQLRAAFISDAVMAARCRLVRAFKAVVVLLRQAIQDDPITYLRPR